MDKYFEELKHEAEENNTGLTNDVFFTEKGTVVKTYSKYPFTSFLESFTSLLNGKLNYISRDERMRNEIEFKKKINDLGFGSAQVIKIGEESIEFDKVPGIDGFTFIKEASQSESKEIGQKIGDFLYDIHNEGVAMNDFRLSNIHVSDSIELYYIDHEYSKLEANSLMQKIDQLTLFSSARQTGKFESFLEGFKKSNSNVKFIPLFLSIFVFGYHALLFDRDYENFVEGMRTLYIW